MNNILIETKNLHKTFTDTAKKLEVLKGIDLEIKKEELLVIQGPSGAGKSTLLHLLGGLDIPTKGSVLIDGVDIYSLSDNNRADIRNRKIGFVFQFYNLLPEFSALENVFLPALINGNLKSRKSDYSKDASGLLDMVKLSHRKLHRPYQLSGGELQRVAIARALMNDPEIIFCDEPTGNLDSKTGDEICELLLKLNKENRKTVVIVTHEQKIASIAKRVVHIRDGQLFNHN
ncbi:MAG: ABC transporter ATP-binding protein [Candidatus Omnitrophica bacterium]|nr:ABC transporter ATP-binding protein [Candidatus Omnitrophota bacterium]HOX53921.1 ABC transporter ATP-binding protein [Candidatus Omnitrophota bacterium]